MIREPEARSSEQRRPSRMVAALAAGVIIGAVECVLAIAFAALVFGGLLASRVPDGIGLYLFAAVLTLGVLAWRAGSRASSRTRRRFRPW